jgi:cell division protein FtsI/penicillin-binding protein 2
MALSSTDTIIQRRRVDILALGLIAFVLILVGRLFYLQVIQHGHYNAKASNEHIRKYQIPASRGEIFVKDGTSNVPLALNQTLKLVYADPALVKDKPAAASELAKILGGSADTYLKRLQGGIEYAVIADRVPNDVADRLQAQNLIGIGMTAQDYRTYPEGQLAAQVLGFVNADGVGQYGVEQYLDAELSGIPGKLAAKTDTNGLPIATADNIQKAPVDGKSYVLTIDRNIQSMVETELAAGVKAAKAKSGSVIVLDPNTGAVKAMATFPTFDPNNYGSITDFSVFSNQTVTSEFEPGSGMKVFTMATGLDQGKVTPDSTYNDPGCLKIDTYNVCDAVGDKPGNGKSMTVVLRDSLNTGVMFVLKRLGGDDNNFTLAGKTILFDYFTKHFGFGTRTGIEQANEAAGAINDPTSQAGNNVNYANMTFGQGMSATMIQMVTGMAAIANGGKLFQPHLIEGELNLDGTESVTPPKLIRDHVISPDAAAKLNQMLQVVVQHGSGYRTYEGTKNKGYLIAGKTGTAQIPRPDGKGYIDGANIGSFFGYAPANAPKFVIMVRINEPGVPGYAESTTVPVFANICQWLFNYYGIAPTN